MFYASPPQIAARESTLLCYGVEQAASVAMEPAVGSIAPAVSRCLQISPTRSTEYRLTAKSRDGRSVSQSVRVTVGGARARILDVRVSALEVSKGSAISICWKAEEAVSAEVHPLPALDPAANPNRNCVADRPAATKVYVLKVKGASGDEDREEIRIRVR
ncbi:MAG: hypothetical protein K2X35_00095 [Bryobacteraceae bacterium]|nr:hypothetical protein [Bryobacteraceae bacterium]